MIKTLRRAMAVALASTTGCGDATEPETIDYGGSTPQIVNGQTDTGDPAVVALTVGGQAFCTGTLIRPTVVLTAAHCLPPNINQFGITSYNQIDVFFGTDVSSGGQFVPVVDGWTHPAWNDQVIEDDIGLVRLASPGPATPIPFREQPMTTGEIGDPVRIIGFGITSTNNQGSSGLKRQATTAISEIFQFVFIMNISPSGTCNGDSGGTALMTLGGTEYVAGIHSRSDCETQSIDTRVDDYVNEIHAFLGETPAPSCNSDGQCASGCSAPDPDCPCAADAFCDGSCPDPNDDPDCSDPCAADGFCDGSCPDDPDCQTACGSDGTCDPGCGDLDPDCTAPTSCPSDGVCDEACVPDPDCWVAGVEGEDYVGHAQSGGCVLAAPSPSSSERPSQLPWWGLVALGAFAARRRRVHSRR